MSQSRRRPKRQRTPTTIYTDDNPTTFTTKPKKGDDHQHHDDGHALPGEASPQGAAPNGETDARPSMPPPARRGPGRPPRKRSASGDDGPQQQPSKPQPQPEQQPQQQPQQQPHPHNTRATGKAPYYHASTLSSKAVSPAPSAARSATPTLVPDQSTTNKAPNQGGSPASPSGGVVVAKRKRGRPPKHRPREPVAAPGAGHTGSGSGTIRNGTIGSGNGTSNGTSTSSNGSARIGKGPPGETKPRQGPTAPPPASVPSSLAQRERPAPRPLPVRRASPDAWGTFLPHSVTLAPILPPVRSDDYHIGAGHHHRESADEGTQKPPAPAKATTPSATTATAATTAATATATATPSTTTATPTPTNATIPATTTTTPPERTGPGLRSAYPQVFAEGIPRASPCLATPFSSPRHSFEGAPSAPKHTKGKAQSQHHQRSCLPDWSPLYDPPVFFEDDYDPETGLLDLSTAMPVARTITAMAVRRPDHGYLVLGDSVGFVTIYSLGPDKVNLPVAQLESVACQQRGKREQDRLRADLRARWSKKGHRGGSGGGTGQGGTGHLGSHPSHASGSSHHPHNHCGPFCPPTGLFANGGRLKPGAQGPSRLRTQERSDAAIHALAMTEHRVVLSTGVELECLDVPSGVSLWVCPLAPNRVVTSLDMHLRTFDVLVSCSKAGEQASGHSSPPSSSLMLLQHSRNKVEICDASSPMLMESPSCTAIWDEGAPNRLLFDALSPRGQEHDLVLVSGGSIDSWKVACKTKIPPGTKAGNARPVATRLSQSPGGAYTLVASARGIRLYHTESLGLLHVYGDQLALHGRSVLWRDCWLAGTVCGAGSGLAPAGGGLPPSWLQCGDLLGARAAGEAQAQKPGPLPPYVIGVPHARGPKELCENLHVWRADRSGVVPAMSLPLPPRSGGALGIAGGRPGGDRIVLVTNDGRGHLLLPGMESDFAGSEYPPGYQVVTDNVEYLEEEDALDAFECGSDASRDTKAGGALAHGAPAGGDGEASSTEDEELLEAVRLSLLEHEEADEDAPVDILGGLGGGENDNDNGHPMDYLPCRPEPYLRQMIKTTAGDDEGPSSDDEEQRPEQETGSTDQRKSPGACETFVSVVLDPMPNVQKPKPVAEDCLSFTTTKVVMAVNPSLMISRQGVPASGRGSGPPPKAVADGKEAHFPRSASPREAATSDEKDVVAGLLGLSPRPPPAGHGFFGARNGGEGCSTEAPSLSAGVVEASCSACRGRQVLHSCGRRSLPIDYEEIARAEREKKEKEEEEKKRVRAEKRRLNDQKRREAKRQKQREAEEQRRREEEQRKEREEQARLQEAFASQDLHRHKRKEALVSYQAAHQSSTDSSREAVLSSPPQSVSNGHKQGAVGAAAAAAAATAFRHYLPSHQKPAAAFPEEYLSGYAAPVQSQAAAGANFQATYQAGNHLLAQQQQQPPETTAYPATDHPVARVSDAPSVASSEQAAFSRPTHSSEADLLLVFAGHNTAKTPTAATATPAALQTATAGLGAPNHGMEGGPASTAANQTYPSLSLFSASHGFDAVSTTIEDDQALAHVRKGIPSYASLRGQGDGTGGFWAASAPGANGTGR
ncbi:unnamed protein product [Pseudo-nitzschia multistriata]|uniref:Uncharacterized protein n=1 Tax=Pseudo-nitzschia multistriata TaxID=183589 RepID=A0A448ZDN2_9STRA|nr:unnamed protein product [Pseudo-nitzschia multistriata]